LLIKALACSRVSCATMMTTVPLPAKQRITSPAVASVAGTVALVCHRYLSRRRFLCSGAFSVKPVN
jgi:hypothetical protein